MAGAGAGWVAVLLMLFLCGCAARPMPDWDLSRPGWTVRQADAVWRPDSKAPELTGELMLAVHADGSRLVQFSKQGLPVVLARADADRWDIRSPLRKGVHTGRGRPPGRLVWFAIDEFPPARPLSSRWRVSRLEAGGWVLEARRGGERLEVVP